MSKRISLGRDRDGDGEIERKDGTLDDHVKELIGDLYAGVENTAPRTDGNQQKLPTKNEALADILSRIIAKYTISVTMAGPRIGDERHNDQIMKDMLDPMEELKIELKRILDSI